MKLPNMKKYVLLYFILFLSLMQVTTLKAQCSICTKTASQLGEKPGRGLNGGIIYLMLMPLAIGGYIGYRWWKNEKVLKEIDAREN
ncbi:MAG TPA: hypothetical protein VFW07_24320 [Parafilimonas sp.]|nr:hypothetical protein [Parafilimonas sp.]